MQLTSLVGLLTRFFISDEPAETCRELFVHPRILADERLQLLLREVEPRFPISVSPQLRRNEYRLRRVRFVSPKGQFVHRTSDCAASIRLFLLNAERGRYFVLEQDLTSQCVREYGLSRRDWDTILRQSRTS